MMHANINIYALQDVCRGDSGGPLLVQHEPGIDTIEGITSGGVGRCGRGIPRWMVRVSVYYDWITCIADGINEGKSKEVIERFCTFKWKVTTPEDKLSKKNVVFE